MLITTILVTICGADGWDEIEGFGLSQQEWLSMLLELLNGIPSHDTFGHIFSILDPKELERCFSAYLMAIFGGSVANFCDRYLRALLIHGARAAITRGKSIPPRTLSGVNQVRDRRGINKAIVALANKNA